MRIDGDAERYNHRDGNDDFGQVKALFDLFDDAHRNRLYANIATAMQGAPEDIIKRQIALFAQVDPAYGAGVAKATGVSG